MGQHEAMVVWSDQYNLGFSEIDGQHQYLVELINQLWSCIVRRAAQDEVLRVLTELELYTIRHFTEEEVFMRTVEYPLFEQHKTFHEEFTSFIGANKRKVAAGEPVSLDVLYYLKDWLLNHILKADRGYADYNLKRQAPKSMLQRLFGRFGA